MSNRQKDICCEASEDKSNEEEHETELDEIGSASQLPLSISKGAVEKTSIAIAKHFKQLLENVDKTLCNMEARLHKYEAELMCQDNLVGRLTGIK